MCDGASASGRWGRRYGHGLVECTWQARLATNRRIAPTPDYATLKRDPIVAAAYDAALRRGLATVAVDDGDSAGIGVRDGGQGGQLPPQFGQFVDMNSGREATLFGQNTIHV